MEKKSGYASAHSEFNFDPTNKVIGIIDSADSAKAALHDLTTAGFSAEGLHLLMDAEGARRIGATSEGHEVAVHIFRPTQKVPSFYDAPIIARRIEQELQAGHYVVGVTAKFAEAKERACEILKSHRGHFINFYGQWAAESLEP